MHPAGRIGEPADVGKLAVYLASDDSAFVTGQVIVIDGGRTPLLLVAWKDYVGAAVSNPHLAGFSKHLTRPSGPANRKRASTTARC